MNPIRARATPTMCGPHGREAEAVVQANAGAVKQLACLVMSPIHATLVLGSRRNGGSDPRGLREGRSAPDRLTPGERYRFLHDRIQRPPITDSRGARAKSPGHRPCAVAKHVGGPNSPSICSMSRTKYRGAALLVDRTRNRGGDDQICALGEKPRHRAL